MARSSLNRESLSTRNTSRPLKSWISARAATALATTMGLLSDSMACAVPHCEPCELLQLLEQSPQRSCAVSRALRCAGAGLE